MQVWILKIRNTIRDVRARLFHVLTTNQHHRIEFYTYAIFWAFIGMLPGLALASFDYTYNYGFTYMYVRNGLGEPFASLSNLSFWMCGYGMSVVGAAANQAVPEQTAIISFLLVFLGASSLLFHSRNSRMYSLGHDLDMLAIHMLFAATPGISIHGIYHAVVASTPKLAEAHYCKGRCSGRCYVKSLTTFLTFAMVTCAIVFYDSFPTFGGYPLPGLNKYTDIVVFVVFSVIANAVSIYFEYGGGLREAAHALFHVALVFCEFAAALYIQHCSEVYLGKLNCIPGVDVTSDVVSARRRLGAKVFCTKTAHSSNHNNSYYEHNRTMYDITHGCWHALVAIVIMQIGFVATQSQFVGLLNVVSNHQRVLVVLILATVLIPLCFFTAFELSEYIFLIYLIIIIPFSIGVCAFVMCNEMDAAELVLSEGLAVFQLGGLSAKILPSESDLELGEGDVSFTDLGEQREDRYVTPSAVGADNGREETAENSKKKEVAQGGKEAIAEELRALCKGAAVTFVESDEAGGAATILTKDPNSMHTTITNDNNSSSVPSFVSVESSSQSSGVGAQLQYRDQPQQPVHLHKQQRVVLDPLPLIPRQAAPVPRLEFGREQRTEPALDFAEEPSDSLADESAQPSSTPQSRAAGLSNSRPPPDPDAKTAIGPVCTAPAPAPAPSPILGPAARFRSDEVHKNIPVPVLAQGANRIPQRNQLPFENWEHARTSEIFDNLTYD